MHFEWDASKADANFKKHGVRFTESFDVFEDDYAITITDDESEPDERRFITVGRGLKGRVMVVVYTYRGPNVRIISARLAGPKERAQYEDRR